jgi:hypothetical protein
MDQCKLVWMEANQIKNFNSPKFENVSILNIAATCWTQDP